MSPVKRVASLCLLLVAACSSQVPPSPSVVVTVPVSVPSSSRPSAPPGETPSPTPIVATTPPRQPPPTPQTLRVGGMARVNVERLRQLYDPERPNAKPPASLGETLAALTRAEEVFLLEGPRRVDGREFWKVAAYRGRTLFGWIPSTTDSGKPAIVPPDEPCPSVSEDFIAVTFPGRDGRRGLSCFGDADVSVRGILSCAEWQVDAFAWLEGASWLESLEDAIECGLGEYDDNMRVYGEVVTSLLDDPNYGGRYTDFVEVTGHFDDPESEACYWVSGNYMPADVSDYPPETAVFACRIRFVATEVRSI
jgi:hypothetical protein